MDLARYKYGFAGFAGFVPVKLRMTVDSTIMTDFDEFFSGLL